MSYFQSASTRFKMSYENHHQKIANACQILSIVGVLLILAIVKLSAEIITPILFSVFIAIIIYPFYDGMIKLKVPVPFFVIFFLVAFAVIGTLLSSLVTSAISALSTEMPSFHGKIQLLLSQAQELAVNRGIDVQINLKSLINPDILTVPLTMMIDLLRLMIGKGVFVLLIAFFITIEIGSIKTKWGRAFPESQDTLDSMIEGSDAIIHYFQIKSAFSLVTGLIIGTALWIMDVRYAALWGVIAFALNYIPTIGSIVAAIPAIIFTLAAYNYVTASYVTILYAAVNLMIGNIIEPRFLSAGSGISTLFVLLSLIIGGFLLGPAGMFMAVPIMLVLKNMLESNQSTRWISVMISDR